MDAIALPDREIADRRDPGGADHHEGAVAEEAARRRTFAVISHPDAGKSTLTEALALHARAIGEAGAVHGKGNRRGVVSDWMEMEKDRGISITSAVLQFAYDGTVINLLDTPGHADFSEDTYRVLAAVDAAVMLVDAAKGIEPQTFKLFEVCRARGVPVITVVNKWDRPGPRRARDHGRADDADRPAPDAADLAGRRRRATSAACSTARPAISSSSPGRPAAPPRPSRRA